MEDGSAEAAAANPGDETVPPPADGAKADGAADEAGPQPAYEEAPEPEPEPDKTMTYAEYMASKGKKEEASGREVTNEFQGKPAAIKKEEEDFVVMGGGKQKKIKKKKEEEKKKVDVGFRVVSVCAEGALSKEEN